MTNEQAIAYCHRHRDDYLSAGGVTMREFDCLISCLESGHIKPEELDAYGMSFPDQP